MMQGRWFVGEILSPEWPQALALVGQLRVLIRMYIDFAPGSGIGFNNRSGVG